jgi:hypothetical protein
LPQWWAPSPLDEAGARDPWALLDSKLCQHFAAESRQASETGSDTGSETSSGFEGQGAGLGVFASLTRLPDMESERERERKRDRPRPRLLGKGRAVHLTPGFVQPDGVPHGVPDGPPGRLPALISVWTEHALAAQMRRVECAVEELDAPQPGGAWHRDYSTVVALEAAGTAPCRQARGSSWLLRHIRPGYVLLMALVDPSIPMVLGTSGGSRALRASGVSHTLRVPGLSLGSGADSGSNSGSGSGSGSDSTEPTTATGRTLAIFAGQGRGAWGPSGSAADLADLAYPEDQVEGLEDVDALLRAAVVLLRGESAREVSASAWCARRALCALTLMVVASLPEKGRRPRLGFSCAWWQDTHAVLATAGPSLAWNGPPLAPLGLSATRDRDRDRGRGRDRDRDKDRDGWGGGGSFRTQAVAGTETTSRTGARPKGTSRTGTKTWTETETKTKTETGAQNRALAAPTRAGGAALPTGPTDADPDQDPDLDASMWLGSGFGSGPGSGFGSGSGSGLGSGPGPGETAPSLQALTRSWHRALAVWSWAASVAAPLPVATRQDAMVHVRRALQVR